MVDTATAANFRNGRATHGGVAFRLGVKLSLNMTPGGASHTYLAPGSSFGPGTGIRKPFRKLPFTADEHQSDVIVLRRVIHKVMHLIQNLPLKLL